MCFMYKSALTYVIELDSDIIFATFPNRVDATMHTFLHTFDHFFCWLTASLKALSLTCSSN